MNVTRGHPVRQRAHRVEDRSHRLAVRNCSEVTQAAAIATPAAPSRLQADYGERTGLMIGDRKRIVSAILPPRLRNAPQLGEVLPLLYLSGIPTSAFGPALRRLLGADMGLSPAMIIGLVRQWQDDAREFHTRSLAGVDYVYVWVDEINPKVRLEQYETCLLVIIGVRSDGRKELIALAGGLRGSQESWTDLLRNCRRRGMTAPLLAVGAGPLGFWKALRDVFPETNAQRCWFHQSADVLVALPRRSQPGAVKAMQDIYNAEDKQTAATAAESFANHYGAKWPVAAAKIADELDALLTFYDYPAEHWIHLRTTNPIESIFTTVRRRRSTMGESGSVPVGVAMAYKLVESAQYRWRAINAPHLTPLLRAEVQSRGLVGRSDNQDQQSNQQSNGHRSLSGPPSPGLSETTSVDPVLSVLGADCRPRGHRKAALNAARFDGERDAHRNFGGLHG